MSAGRHRRPSKTSAMAAAAVPAVTAGAVAVTIAAAPAHARVLPATPTPPPVTTQAAGDYTVHAHRLPAGPRTVIVIGGDTLSGIARDDCGNTADWTGLYEGNKETIGDDPDVIIPGQRLVLDCRRAAYTPPRQPAAVTVVVAAPHQAAAPAGGNVNPGDYSGFQQCVITRESGGRSQVMNSSGHYGLYQFDLRTWMSGGGAAADFGHASVAEQNRVFAAVYAARGTNPWAPYDGC